MTSHHSFGRVERPRSLDHWTLRLEGPDLGSSVRFREAATVAECHHERLQLASRARISASRAIANKALVSDE